MQTSRLAADRITSYERVRCEYVPASPIGTPAWYALTAVDEESGAVLGRRLTPAKLDGTPPDLTTAELMRLMGGAYRLACVRVDHALDRLMELNNKCDTRRRASWK